MKAAGLSSTFTSMIFTRAIVFLLCRQRGKASREIKKMVSDPVDLSQYHFSNLFLGIDSDVGVDCGGVLSLAEVKVTHRCPYTTHHILQIALNCALYPSPSALPIL